MMDDILPLDLKKIESSVQSEELSLKLQFNNYYYCKLLLPSSLIYTGFEIFHVLLKEVSLDYFL